MKTKRTDRHEPTPAEVFGYIRDAISTLADRAKTGYWSECAAHITIGEIRLVIAHRMALRGEYFTSAYRHGETPEHEIAHDILCGTVSLNDLIESKRAILRAGHIPPLIDPAAALRFEVERKGER